MYLTTKGKIVFTIAGIVIGIAALAAIGYIIFQLVNKNVGPTGSEAGGENGGCPAGYTCSGSCNGCRQNCYYNGELCGTVVCGGGALCQCKDGWQMFCPSDGKSCSELCGDEEEPVTQCTCAGGYGNECGYNCQFPSGTSCQSEANANCVPYVAMCSSSGTVGCEEYKPGHKCYGKLEECGNPLFEPEKGVCFQDCKCGCPSGLVCQSNKCVNPSCPTESDCTCNNVCEGGSLTSPVAGLTFKKGDTVVVQGTAVDKDGVKDFVIKINNVVMNNVELKFSLAGTAPNFTWKFEYVIPQAGNYAIAVSWKDGLDAVSVACSAATTFIGDEEESNPLWKITKVATPICVNEGSENPYAEVRYEIKVAYQNTTRPDIKGILTKLEDKPVSLKKIWVLGDSFVPPYGSLLESKTVPGLVETILWNLSGTNSEFTSGSSKSYTYKVNIPSANFGTYINTAKGYPSIGQSFEISNSTFVDCDIAGKCNSSCTTTDDCVTGLSCIQNKCVNSKCPGDDNCQCEDLPETAVLDNKKIFTVGLPILGIIIAIYVVNYFDLTRFRLKIKMVADKRTETVVNSSREEFEKKVKN